MSREKTLNKIKKWANGKSVFELMPYISTFVGKRFMIEGFNITLSEEEMKDVTGLEFGFTNAKPKNLR